MNSEQDDLIDSTDPAMVDSGFDTAGVAGTAPASTAGGARPSVADGGTNGTNGDDEVPAPTLFDDNNEKTGTDLDSATDAGDFGYATDAQSENVPER